MAKEKISPGMQQYLDIKENYPDAFLLFRMGDFYELFYDDAVKAAQILEISLTSRNKNADNPIPMAGVPYHSAQGRFNDLRRWKAPINEAVHGVEISTEDRS